MSILGAFYKTAAGGADPTWEVLDNHIVANDTTESTYTLTKTIDFATDYAAIFIMLRGRCSAETEFNCKINGITEYHTQYTQNDAGTVSGIADGGASVLDLVQATLLNVARSFSVGMYITTSAVTASFDQFQYWGFGNSSKGFATFRGHTVNQSEGVNFTSIEYDMTNSATWSGSHFTTYGIKSVVL